MALRFGTSQMGIGIGIGIGIVAWKRWLLRTSQPLFIITVP
jgi:hypothetical protein